MEQIRILLSCGAGMSSGFLANKARKAAKKKGLNVKIEAKSESEVSAYLPSIHILLLGPHYASQLKEFRALAAPYNVKVDVIPTEIYAILDGEGLVEFALNLE